MGTSILFAILFLFAGIGVYFAFIASQKSNQINQTKRPMGILILLLGSLIIKILLCPSFPGHPTDISCFNGWSESVFRDGFAAFYTSGSFADYPPGYVYVLYVIGFLRSVFHISTASSAGLILVKLPAVLSDLGIGALIYHCAKKHFSEWNALFLAALYLFNPATIVDSSLWGQVDSVFTLFVCLSVYFAATKRVHFGYILFVIGVLLKPQTLIFTPVLIYATIDAIWHPKFDGKALGKLCLYFVGSMAGFFLVCLPYGILPVIEQYFKTLDSYQYVTVNAFNTYILFDCNWKGLEGIWQYWGTAMILLLVIGSVFVFWKSRKQEDESRYFWIASFIIFAMFMLSTKMHERYLFPILPLLLLAYALRPKAEFYFLYLGISIFHFVNTAYILFVYDVNTYFEDLTKFKSVAIPVSVLTLLAFVWFLSLTYRYYIKPQTTLSRQQRRHA